MSAADRAWRFDRAVGERAADRVERFELGAAIYSDDLPRVYDANLVWIDAGVDGLDADDLERLVERLQGDLGHRKVILPGGDASERLATELAARGWSLAPTVVMEYAGEREREPQSGAATAEQVDVRAVRGARMDALAGHSADARRQVADYTERLGDAANGRVFAAFESGEVAAFCVLLEGDGLGEIDEVTTLERFRRCGLGTAVVEAALAASLAAGHDLTFLVAAANDWPRQWYERLGFEVVGDRWEIYKT